MKLTPNPTPAPENPSPESTERAQFVCPLTLKEMNGVQPFVYIQPCGCVLSQAGLKTVSGSSSPKEGGDESDAKSGEEAAGKQLDVCPQCAIKYDKSSDIILLNPSREEEERMFSVMLLIRASEPAKAKKSKKRKNAPSDSTTDAAPPATKSQKTNASQAPHTNPSISAASRAVVSSLAMEEAKRKAGMSDVVKSLYSTEESREGQKKRETFMTKGTFTRVSTTVLPLYSFGPFTDYWFVLQYA